MVRKTIHMKKLPKKWCIKLVSKEINDAVNSIGLWRDEKLYWGDSKGYTDFYIGYDGCYETHLLSSGYTEITFAQFKHFILKEPLKTTKDYEYLIPIIKKLNNG